MDNEATSYLLIAAVASSYAWGIAAFLMAYGVQRVMLAVTATLIVALAWCAEGVMGLVMLPLGAIGVLMGAWIVVNGVSAVLTARIRRTHGPIGTDFIGPGRFIRLLWD